MNKLGKIESRRILTIWRLLNYDKIDFMGQEGKTNKKVSRKEIKSFLDEYISIDSNEYDKKNEITNEMLTNLLVPIENEGIIESAIYREKKGRGNKPFVYWLKEDHETLFKITKEFYNPKLNKGISRHLGYSILHSNYGKKLINFDLVTKLEKNINVVFNNNEKMMILNIIKISPEALLIAFENADPKFIEEIQKNDGINEITEEYIKQKYIFKLQLQLGEDLFLHRLISPVSIEYEINLTVKPIKIGNKLFQDQDSKKLKQNVSKNKIKSVLNPIIGDPNSAMDSMILPIFDI